MLRELMSHTTLLHLPIFAMAMFFTVFMAIFVKTMRTRREVIDQLARLPLDEGESAGEDAAREEDSHG